MIFADVPDGSSIFVDANIFVYALLGSPRFGIVCESFLERAARGELRAYTSAHVLSNVAHRLMTVEACAVWGLTYNGIAGQLQRHPEKVMRLQNYKQSVQGISRIQVEIWPVTAQDVFRATEVSQQQGLLSNDALIIAMMQANGVTQLASADSDFDRIPGIVRIGPE